MVDMQEMVIWSMLNWRILRWDDIAQEYEKLATASGYCTERSWKDCTNRLLTGGLLVSGSGETEYDALYDLLGSLQHYPNQRTVLPPARLFCQADAAGTCSGIRYAETVPERLTNQIRSSGHAPCRTSPALHCRDHQVHR